MSRCGVPLPGLARDESGVAQRHRDAPVGRGAPDGSYTEVLGVVTAL